MSSGSFCSRPLSFISLESEVKAEVEVAGAEVEVGVAGVEVEIAGAEVEVAGAEVGVAEAGETVAEIQVSPQECGTPGEESRDPITSSPAGELT